MTKPYRPEVVWETVQARLRQSVPQSEWKTIRATKGDDEFETVRYTDHDVRSLVFDLQFNGWTVEVVPFATGEEA